MLEQHQSPGSRTWANPANNIQKSETPSYFKVVPGYEIIPVGPKTASYKVANETGYDLYILAGIDDNELFSKLVTMNLNIPQGIAFDENTSKISQFFPENIKVIGKKVSFKNDNYSENLSGINGHQDIFMKMNIYGEEYLWILSASVDTLNKFKQMVIVFHDINNNPTQQRALNKIKCFKKLTETHEVVHIEPVENNLVVTYFRKNSKSSDISSQPGSVTPLPLYHDELEDDLLFEVSDDDEDEDIDSKQISQAQIEQLELSKRIKRTTQKIAKNMVKKMFKTIIHETSSELTKEIETILGNLNLNKPTDTVSIEDGITLDIEEETPAEPKDEPEPLATESIETKNDDVVQKEPKKRNKKVVDLKEDSSKLDEIASASIKETTEIVQESLPLE